MCPFFFCIKLRPPELGGSKQCELPFCSSSRPQPQLPLYSYYPLEMASSTTAPSTTQPPPAKDSKASGSHSRSSSSQAPRKVRFNVGSRYQVLDVIGEGAYGVVSVPFSSLPSPSALLLTLTMGGWVGDAA